MKVFLMFSPTRTRRYTRTMLDLTNDFFVRFTTLEAVCATLEATAPVGQNIIEALRDDCDMWEPFPYQLSTEWAVWKDFIPQQWQDACGIQGADICDLPVGEPPPERVFVVLEERSKRIWGGQHHLYFKVADVFVDDVNARRHYLKSPYQVIEMPLLGLPANA